MQIHCQRLILEEKTSPISQNSSGCPDEFSAILLKRCSKCLAHPLQLHAVTSLKTGEIPIDLKRALITAIYKGGYRSLPKNYRPVSLTSHLIKIVAKILSKKYPPIPGNASENELQATRLSLRQICLSKLLEHHKIFTKWQTQQHHALPMIL